MRLIPHFAVVATFLLSLIQPNSTALDAQQTSPAPNLMWCKDARPGEQDYYVGFRGSFDLTASSTVEIRILGASWFGFWLDGAWIGDGPARFPIAYPEYQTFRFRLSPGTHRVAVQVHQLGVSTRMLDNPDPFLLCDIAGGGQPLPVRWKCSRLAGYTPKVRRINPQLGFIEWNDTRSTPDWLPANFNDKNWSEPIQVTRPLGALKPLSTANTRSVVRSIKPMASGNLIESFGYEQDDPAARFFLRNLSPNGIPPQGIWRRYDLGRVRLMRPRFILDLPRDAVVEFAYNETLNSGRVPPWVTLSAGDSCNMDHYVARGGRQEFFPLTPKGGRFLEMHILAPPQKIQIASETIVERTYYGEPEGAFTSSDPLLSRIWSVGVETHRACAEDSLEDNPTRERGQWAGDVVSVGMDVAASAYSDLRLCRRGLIQCAQSAREDGLVSGLCPGGGAYLSTYAAQWVSASVHYWELTGDLHLLEVLMPYAEKNISAFEKQRTRDGLADALGWGFVDWGYVRNPGPSDMAVNLHYLAALRDMIRWCNALGKRDRAAEYERIAGDLGATIQAYYDKEFATADSWNRIGYHRAALGLRLGFFKGARIREAVSFIKAHMLKCFPNDVTAPRLTDPSAANPRLITPYFAHFAMQTLIENGEVDFALNQYRKCWGWALEDGRTTWLEVFDTRWSHCHQWSGSPTWQMTRYLLGLRPRFDLGEKHYELNLKTGSLPNASGKLPVSGGGVIQISWKRTGSKVAYTVVSAVPITIHLSGSSKTIKVNGSSTFQVQAN